MLEAHGGRALGMLFEPGDHRVDELRLDSLHEAGLRVRADRARLVEVARSLQRDVVDRLEPSITGVPALRILRSILSASLTGPL